MHRMKKHEINVRGVIEVLPLSLSGLNSIQTIQIFCTRFAQKDDLLLAANFIDDSIKIGGFIRDLSHTFACPEVKTQRERKEEK